MIPDSPDAERVSFRQPSQEDSLEVGPKGIRVQSRDLPTLLAALAVAILTASAYMLYTHTQDTRSASQELVMALRELTKGVREQNCLYATKGDGDLCRRIAQ